MSEKPPVKVVEPPLPQVAGYCLVVVFGLMIACGMVFITKLLKRTVGEDNKRTEMFMTANRSVTTGLTTSAVISSWLWSTAMLGSSLVGYNFGAAGPFWFAAGCSPMIVFFALLGISCKRKVPEAHTLLEIVRLRYGKAAHIVYMFLCLLNNVIACANMLLGASAAISAMSGMNTVAATFLLPVGVAVYTFVGGIKATFLTDYMHTSVILIILCYFTVQTFMIEEISSIGNIFDLVVSATNRNPIAENEAGSYMTLASKGGIMFGILHTLANFGLVIMDTSFFIKAFSASPSAVVPGYIFGGILYFAIPYCMGTLASSVVLGLEDNPIFPTFPRRMTPVEVSNGLVLPYFAVTIAGKGGAAAILLVTFMAVTSTLSAQVIAVSSIISFDIYRTYVRPQASDGDIIRLSHYGVVFFALFSAAFSTALYYGGVDLGWTLYMLGILTCPGIFPTTFTILWKKQSRAAAIIAPLLGLITGMAAWFGSAYSLYGEVSVATTGGIVPCVWGTVAAAFSPAVYSIIISLLKPQDWQWSDFRKEHLAFQQGSSNDPSPSSSVAEDESESPDAQEKELKRASKMAALWSALTFLGHWVLWPLPMYAAYYVFSKGFYTAWLVVSMIWLWIAAIVAIFFPIISGRDQLVAVYYAIRGRSAASQPAGHAGRGAGNETSSSAPASAMEKNLGGSVMVESGASSSN